MNDDRLIHMKNIFVIFVLITFSILTTDLKAETRKVPNHASKIILHDGMFEDGLPNRFEIDDSKKKEVWGWGNWRSREGNANFFFAQQGQGRILTELGMLPKKVLKTWGVENYKLGKKKGFKSSGSRALVRLVNIKDQNCVVVITRFSGVGATNDIKNRVRSGVEGYICKNSGEITIDEGMNFLHCVELKGDGTNFVGRKIDDKCVKKEIAKKVIKKSSETKKSRFLYCKDNEDVHEYINGPSSCYEGQTQITKEQYLESKKNLKNTSTNTNEDSFEKQLERLKSLFDKKLITKEEYDAERKEILDEM